MTKHLGYVSASYKGSILRLPGTRVCNDCHGLGEDDQCGRYNSVDSLISVIIESLSYTFMSTGKEPTEKHLAADIPGKPQANENQWIGMGRMAANRPTGTGGNS